MKLRRPLLAVTLLVALCAAPAPARADIPGLQVSPLDYQDVLIAGHNKDGYVDVSNPGDSAVQIEASVRGFRQTGTDGRLEFFDDPALASGVTVDLPSFVLGPREAIRVGFHVNPSLLPTGGVYAAIFFRTVPPDQSSGSSFVAESANIGTLLELTNGTGLTHEGAVTKARFGFWQFGSGLSGSLDYRNTDTTPRALGFRPSLTLQVLPWGRAPKLSSKLVLPGATRNFTITRPGSYFGLLPLIITDSESRHQVVTWVFACTGWYQWGVIVLLIIIILLLPSKLLQGLRRRPKPLVKRPLDGLSRPKR